MGIANLKPLHLALLQWLEDNITCDTILKRHLDPAYCGSRYEYYVIFNEHNQILYLCSVDFPEKNVLLFKEDGPATTSIIRLTLDKQGKSQSEIVHEAKEEVSK